MSRSNELYPTDEIQLLIDTYLPQDDEQYYLDFEKPSTEILCKEQETLFAEQRFHEEQFYTNENALPLDIFEFISTNSEGFSDESYQLMETRNCSSILTEKSFGPETGTDYLYKRQGSFSDARSVDSESSSDGIADTIPLPVTTYEETLVGVKMENLDSPITYGTDTPESVDSDSTPCSPTPETSLGSRQRRKRPSRRRQKQLWEFILETLSNPKHNPECITWLDKDTGVFKFVKSQQVARLWGMRRQREMSYEYFSRAMRHYYARNIMKRVQGKRLVYQFCSGAEGWRNYAQNSPA